MIQQLLIGTLIIGVTLIVQVIFIGAAIALLSRLAEWFNQPPKITKMVIALITAVLWLVLGISVSAWVWAIAFLYLGSFSALEPALYFSIVTFTTLGYGDIIIAEKWRLLAGLTAANGLIIFGLNTAFLAEFLTRLRHTQK